MDILLLREEHGPKWIIRDVSHWVYQVTGQIGFFFGSRADTEKLEGARSVEKVIQVLSWEAEKICTPLRQGWPHKCPKGDTNTCTILKLKCQNCNNDNPHTYMTTMLSNQKNSIKNAKPIGVVLRISGDGENMRSPYNALDFCGHTYKIKDTVLLAHDSHGQMNKPWVVIIKDITGMKNGNIMIYVQWFYRPSEIFIGKNMESFDTRELFNSFHKDEVHAETIMHKCIIHFITEKSQIPLRKKYPGFIVQKVYNPNTKRLIKLTNKDFLPNMKSEIEELVLKTTSHLGIILAIKSEDDVDEMEVD
ncbi:bromo adjacent homology (BAH) domain protein [Artemisia annua]|uniref:Bromo adjacent homology (BAH) domain protein n=1 Tax=Artemisia annua TaxID=35608 RepID=A0A2U1PNH3_ARTAN|nr:bromo adjacent homology (BAH) domain protein [Artemisia annua]